MADDDLETIDREAARIGLDRQWMCSRCNGVFTAPSETGMFDHCPHCDLPAEPFKVVTVYDCPHNDPTDCGSPDHHYGIGKHVVIEEEGETFA